LVSVVIPHYDDFGSLARCLDALRRQTLPRAEFEVIVADNNSVGGVAAVQRIAGDFQVVAAPVQGAGPARNAGAAAANGKYLAFIDCDCVPGKNWLAEGLAALNNYDYAGGQVIIKTGGVRDITPAEAVEAVFAFTNKRNVERDRFSVSANLFVPKAMFDGVGGFRVGVSEDMDWCWRANAVGYHLGFADRAVAYHAARRDWSELKRKWDRIVRERYGLACEQPKWRLRWMIYAAAVAGSPLVHWIFVLRSRRLIGLKAKWCGLVGLVGARSYRSYRMISILLKDPNSEAKTCHLPLAKRRR
jgi:GT2 family glycosyltransferase